MSLWSKLGQSLYQHRIAALTAAFILLVDQITKDLAYTLWDEGGPSVWGVSFHFSRNPGLALGYFSGLPVQFRVPVIILISFAAAIGIALISRSHSGSKLRGWGLSFLYAGALGNSIDRLWRGYVIDFIEPSFRGSVLPSFNIADLSVTVGALMVAFVVIIGAKRPKHKGGAMESVKEMELSVESNEQETQLDEARRAGALFKMMPGTTLVEILVVVAIIGLVMGAVAIGVIPLFAKGQKGIAWNDTKSFEQMYTVWQISHTDCPTSVEDLAKSAAKKGQSTKDPWGNDYVISCPSQHDNAEIDICSNGPDKQQGTEDDVCNWKPQPKD